MLVREVADAMRKTIERIVITGSSGYVGRKLVRRFRSSGCYVLGIDIAPAGAAAETEVDENAPHEFLQSDIRVPGILDTIRDFQPDTVIHSAFVVRPMRDSGEMNSININGTKNIVDVVRKLKPARFLFLSSATAYGAWPDNPLPLPDGSPLRPRPDYQYSAEKAALEQQVQELAETTPETAVSWVRPAIVGGPGMNNYLSRFIFALPVFLKLDKTCPVLQFVHEDDVVGAIEAIVKQGGRGAYNLAPPDWTTIREIAKHTGKWLVPMPFFVAYGLAWLAWKTRFYFYEAPPGFLYFARYPWALAPDRLVNEIGYTFRHSSTETMKESSGHQSWALWREGYRQARSSPAIASSPTKHTASEN